MNSDPSSLNRLHDLVVPPPVSWWPPAPGWYWLMGIGLVIGFYLLLREFVRWQHNRYRREALAQWRIQWMKLADANTRVAATADLAVLLKRAALSAFPRNQVASLTGGEWMAFLDQTGQMDGFASEAGKLLEQAAYDCITPAQCDEARANQAAMLVYRWLRRHRAQSPGKGAA